MVFIYFTFAQKPNKSHIEICLDGALIVCTTNTSQNRGFKTSSLKWNVPFCLEHMPPFADECALTALLHSVPAPRGSPRAARARRALAERAAGLAGRVEGRAAAPSRSARALVHHKPGGHAARAHRRDWLHARERARRPTKAAGTVPMRPRPAAWIDLKDPARGTAQFRPERAASGLQ